MVEDAEEGFEKVLGDKEGTFAFIHDASQVNQQHMLSVYSKLNLLYVFITFTMKFLAKYR